MSENIALLRLQDAWRECERNIYFLNSAINLLEPCFPMTGEIFGALTDDQIRSLDQFVLRFTKLQDAMGNHLFPSILQFLQEPYEDRPMLDKLNRLEKIGYINSSDLWQDIRNIRNKLTHDYPDDWDRNATLINMAREVIVKIHVNLYLIEKKLKVVYPELALGKSILAIPVIEVSF
jgi:hypothetical protein